MKKLLLPTAILVGLLPFGAGASTVQFGFTGPGVSGTVQITYGTATDAIYSQAFEITGISGVFSDSNNGLDLVNVPIQSLVPISPATPEPGNTLAPADFSRFAVASGLSPDNNGFLTYDNLYYPGGSPQTASDYPPHGGILDIYGLMFNIAGGDVVDLWSNGNLGSGPDYGVAVATSAKALDYVGGGVTVTPEPMALPLLIGALLIMFCCRLRPSAAKRS